MTFVPRFPNAPHNYDAQNEAQFRGQVRQAMQDSSSPLTFSVDVPGTSNQILVHNGTSWVAQAQSALAIAASQITSGTFADARIAGSNVTQHQAALAIAASQIASGTFADARIAESNVTQHQSALAIAASQITSGTFGAGTFRFDNDLTVDEVLVVGTTTVPAELGAGDVFAEAGILAFGSSGASNIDHLWHDETGNIWHAVSDTTRKAVGNSRFRVGAGSAASCAIQMGAVNTGLAIISGRIAFVIGGAVVASLDSSGNLRVLADVTADDTP